MTGIGTTSVRVSDEWLKIIDAWTYLLQHIDEKYIDLIVYYISMRIELCINKYWLFKYEYIKWVKDHAELFLDNDFIKNKEPNRYKYLKNLIERNYELIPSVIYINGFGKEDIRYRVKEIYETIPGFRECGGKVIVLNQTNCDIDGVEHIKRAFNEGEIEYLGHYFALKKIYEEGGFYVGDHIRFTATLEGVQGIAPAIFSYLTPTTFSDEIFGAIAGNPFVRKLLETYQIENYYPDKYYPLKDRIQNILISFYNVELDGKPQFVRKIAYLADPHKFVRNVSELPYTCEHDFSECFGKVGYSVLPDDLYVLSSTKVLDNSQEILQMKEQIENLSDKCRLLEQHIENDESSEAWKIGLTIAKLANSPILKPLKALYMSLQKNRKGEKSI